MPKSKVHRPKKCLSKEIEQFISLAEGLHSGRIQPQDAAVASQRLEISNATTDTQAAPKRPNKQSVTEQSSANADILFSKELDQAPDNRVLSCVMERRLQWEELYEAHRQTRSQNSWGVNLQVG
jgi:hypothetical protein